MGCGESKLSRRECASPAVALCCGRSELLAEAITRLYALASAHRAYAASLTTTGAALLDFLRAAPPRRRGMGTTTLIPIRRRLPSRGCGRGAAAVA
ncbi:unnamed protein product [Urochloa humidicola]